MRKSVVAIVGRPNVGKSTLFNRIIGKRKAITDSTPGVTRDRNYSDVSWAGRSFILIDTGGFEPVAKDKILLQMKEQMLLAVEEADVIIFLVDSKDGLMPGDKEFLDLLRSSNKPIISGVNKVDVKGHEDRAYEFHKLGIGDIYPISAEHGRGVDVILDRILELIPEYKEEEKAEDMVKVAVVGRPNVGKSSLVNNILNEERVLVSDLPGTTRDPIDTYFQVGEKGYLFIDTAGIRSKGRVSNRIEKYCIIMALKMIERSDIALILIDAVEGITEQDTKIAGYAHNMGCGAIIVVNKWDLIEKNRDTITEFTIKIKSRFKYLSYAPIITVSATSGQRVDKIIPLIDKVATAYSIHISTPLLNRTLRDAVDKRPPPIYKVKVLKFFYITQIKSRPPTFVLFVNYPEGVHFSYLRYIQNQIRRGFDLEGTPIRIFLKKKR
ncbi:MAG: ribosome biogenesis GTPase Der [Nitrospinae bacterium]|nr:ribosome biogenesis GTPase Der [Nitrospinota bacterium]